MSWYFCTFVLLFHQYLHICSSASSSSSSSFSTVADLFENWRQEHGKTYPSEQEKQYRLRVLEDNYNYITQHNNKDNLTYTLSLNAFSDLTHHEFKAKYLLGRPDLSASANDLESSSAAKPIRIGICASDRSFQFYSRGILTGTCCDTLNHVVLIVGYDSRNGIQYWNIKNSWGTAWGMNGYMHLERKNEKNSCGINNNIRDDDDEQELITIKYPLIKEVSNPSPSPNPSPGQNPPPPVTWVRCDPFSICHKNETCCCILPVGDQCISWGCCPQESATCCKDGKHCCPKFQPICSDKFTECLSKNGTASILAHPIKNATRHE